MKNKMAKPLGLTSRGSSKVVRIVVPTDLREAYGRTDFRITLKARGGPAASAEAHRLRAQKDAEFEARRKELAGAVNVIETITPELSAAIARGVYAAGLAQDDAAREDTGVIAALQEVFEVEPVLALRIAPTIPRHPEAPHPTPDGVSEEVAKVMAELNDLAEANAAIDLARRRLSIVQPAADAVAKAMGLVIDWTTDDGKATLKASLSEYRRARRDRAARDVGEDIPTPPAANAGTVKAIKATSKAHTLRDVLPLWKATKQPATNTYNKVAYAVGLAEQSMGAVPLSQFTKANASDFIAFLLAKCKTDKTAKDHFDSIKSLLNFACDMQGWIAANPWRAHRVTVKKRRQRKPWPSDALVKLFDSPLFKSYSLPTVTPAGGAAAYWVPLLGLYTGARQSELCQLRVEDVSKEQNGLVISIVADAGDEDEDVPETVMKTDTTQRRVPVHSELIRLGFGDYVEDMKEAGHAGLFPDVKRAPGRPAGEYFSDWFRDYRGEQKVQKRYQDFHAFRHTSRTRLTDAGVEDVISAALLGHTIATNTGRNTYDHSTATLRPNLEKLRFDELGLVRCYPVRKNRN